MKSIYSRKFAGILGKASTTISREAKRKRVIASGRICLSDLNVLC